MKKRKRGIKSRARLVRSITGHNNLRADCERETRTVDGIFKWEKVIDLRLTHSRYTDSLHIQQHPV